MLWFLQTTDGRLLMIAGEIVSLKETVTNDVHRKSTPLWISNTMRKM